jgi:hypothetical protein
MGSKPTPKEIAEELLRMYCDALHFHGELAKYEDADPPESLYVFEMVFDVLGLPTREEFHRRRVPNPRKPDDYLTRDALIQEFHRIYDDPSIGDDKFVEVFLKFLEELTPGNSEPSAPTLPPATAG